MLRRFLDWIWSYDFFISYSHADGSLNEGGKPRSHYARALAQQLRELHFAVFHDESEYDPGVELNSATVRRVRASGKLLVIARPAAMTSPWVLKEVNSAIRHGNDVVVIDINETYENTAPENPLRQAIGDSRLRFVELLENSDGDPSTKLIAKLHAASDRSRRDRRRQRLLMGILLFFILATVGLYGLYQWARYEQHRAELRRLVAEMKQGEAEAESAFSDARRISMVRDDLLHRLRKVRALPDTPGARVREEEIAQLEASLAGASRDVTTAWNTGSNAVARSTASYEQLREAGYAALTDPSSEVQVPRIFSIEMLRSTTGGEATVLHYGPIIHPRFVLIDGGGIHPDSYRQCLYPRLRDLAQAWSRDGVLRLEAVIASQWDAQRTRGIHGLLESLNDPADGYHLPLKIETLWYNVFPRDRFDSWKYEIAGLASNAGIPVNSPFDHHIVRPDDSAVSLEFEGGLRVTVLNPRQTDLDKYWKWLFRQRSLRDYDGQGDRASLESVPVEQFQDGRLHLHTAVGEPLTIAEGGRRRDPSVVNQSSIALLFEYANRNFLYCGDANDVQLLDGLHAAGRLDETGGIEVDVLHIPHSGSDFNVSEEFFRRVRANNYLITGDGQHNNPEPETLDMIIAARAGQPMTWHFAHRDSPDSLGEALDAYFAEREITNVLRTFREDDELSTKVHLLEPFRY